MKDYDIVKFAHTFYFNNQVSLLH